MSTTEQIREHRRAAANRTCALELVSTRGVFCAGDLLTGIVVLRAARPIANALLRVSVRGTEQPAQGADRKGSPQAAVFFVREKLLSGVEPPRAALERLSVIWNAFLGRTKKRTIAAGEHIYPFAVSLPASLPPSYSGSAGKIVYVVRAELSGAFRRSLTVEQFVEVSSGVRIKGASSAAVREMAAVCQDGRPSPTARLEIENAVAELGSEIRGRFVVANSGEQPGSKSVSISLELSECVRGSQGALAVRRRVDQTVVQVPSSGSDSVEGDFRLRIPADAPPTVEAASISVSWEIRLHLDGEPPVEMSCPIKVVGGASCSEAQGVS
ncbi:MAG: hypothetical protein QHI38_12530 [Armatimonadota bacterium]|nr:hypothetical protein [Armatimonadota bacterium]